MNSKKSLNSIIFLLLALVVCGGEKVPQQEEKVEILSKHRTVARFDGQEYRVCSKQTGSCPDRCGSSGDYALFSLLGYIKHEYLKKDGPVGAKWKHFKFQINNLYRKKDWGKAELAEAKKAHPDRGDLAGKAIQGLKAGDLVLLDWDRILVIKKKTSYVENRILKLQKIDREKVVELIGLPLPNPKPDRNKSTNNTPPRILKKR